MFIEERKKSQFDWSMIGDIATGRPNLGNMVDVSVYRLMQYTLREAMIVELDVKTADKLFYRAGEFAGREFCKNVLSKNVGFNEFILELQAVLKDLKIGILRVENADIEKMDLSVTVAEDLDCSGLPVCDETVCTFDEGFIGGILLEYSGVPVTVKEVDCWCTGDRVCRFSVKKK